MGPPHTYEEIEKDVLELMHETSPETNIAISKKMWSSYIQFCLSLARSRNAQTEMKKILKVFSRASKNSFLSVDGFLEWYRLASDSKEPQECGEILDLALKRYPRCSEMWRTKIIRTMESGNVEEIIVALDKALATAEPEDSFEIWSTAIRWFAASGDNDKVKELYEKSLSAPANVSTRLKVKYLEWMADSRGIKAAFKLFRRIWSMPPVCKEIMYKMCELEQSKLKPSMRHIHEIMENFVKNFGKTDVNVWIYYVKLERQNSEDICGVSRVHSQAIRMLEPHLVDEFITHYTLLTTYATDSMLPLQS